MIYHHVTQAGFDLLKSSNLAALASQNVKTTSVKERAWHKLAFIYIYANIYRYTHIYAYIYTYTYVLYKVIHYICIYKLIIYIFSCRARKGYFLDSDENVHLIRKNVYLMMSNVDL